MQGVELAEEWIKDNSLVFCAIYRMELIKCSRIQEKGDLAEAMSTK